MISTHGPSDKERFRVYKCRKNMSIHVYAVYVQLFCKNGSLALALRIEEGEGFKTKKEGLVPKHEVSMPREILDYASKCFSGCGHLLAH